MSGLVPSTLHPLLPYWVSPHNGLLIQDIRYLRTIGGNVCLSFGRYRQTTLTYAGLSMLTDPWEISFEVKVEGISEG